MSGISIAYSGVHRIYQVALAAQDMDSLDKFFCSLIDAPGKWGNLLSTIVGSDRLINMRRPELEPKNVQEFPWPLLKFYLLPKTSRTDMARAEVNDWFDRWVAKQLKSLDSKIFVGGETCARYSLEVARQKGITTILDCPQVHPDFLTSILNASADDLQIQRPEPFDNPQIAETKGLEFSMADILLMLSEFQKRTFLAAGFPEERMISIPYWIDTDFFQPVPIPTLSKSKPLRVLFVGSIGFRKGIPYLLQAIDLCKTDVELTLLGSITPEIKPFLAKYEGSYTYASPTTKVGVRQHYWQADVLVLPSLVDTFGWVAMEAMACGLPIIVSDNCGVPVPDERWRVPVMNAEAIAQKLLVLRDNWEYCHELGQIAANFAKQFTPQRHNQQLQILFKQLLS
ncbi:glycosyltransferase family 4 protein [Nostoc sp. CCY0012]|uniref:glycosyltransferase family 4 protein n=1 Tax=Nostoc sp. CCY0012 TaxID=1056123 RepID=UPI0039C70E68